MLSGHYTRILFRVRVASCKALRGQSGLPLCCTGLILRKALLSGSLLPLPARNRWAIA